MILYSPWLTREHMRAKFKRSYIFHNSYVGAMTLGMFPSVYVFQILVFFFSFFQFFLTCLFLAEFFFLIP